MRCLKIRHDEDKDRFEIVSGNNSLLCSQKWGGTPQLQIYV